MPQNAAENEQSNGASGVKAVFHSVLRNVFKTELVLIPPWPRMILCTLATVFPLVLGYFREEIPLAVFGGLTGYLLALNDHLGPLRHRLWVMTLSVLILFAGFALGFHVQGERLVFLSILALVTYWLGILGGEGAELERAVLFALIGFITAVVTPSIAENLLTPLLIYSLISYFCLMLGIPIVYWIGRHPAVEHAGLRRSLKKSLTLNIERHLHAACFTAMVLLSEWIASEWKSDHGSWITVTVLIILRPNQWQTIYRTLQRLIGTIVGVLCADLFVLARPSAWLVLLALAVCAFVIPWMLAKSYWLASFLITVFVVLLLELASGNRADFHVGTLRIEATFIGCCVSLIGVGLTRAVDRIFKRMRIMA